MIGAGSCCFCPATLGDILLSDKLNALPLEVGGIVSEAPLEEMAENARQITEAFKRLGYAFPNPIMSFSVLGLSVAPRLRITDKGYVDTKRGLLLPLFEEENENE